MPITLRPTADRINDATLTDLGDGSWEIVTTGRDPWVFLAPAEGKPTKGASWLAFEYASPTGTDNLQVYVTPPIDEPHSVTGGGLALSEGWSSHSIDIGEALDLAQGKFEALRLDPGTEPGKRVRIRAITLRKPTAREQELLARQAERRVQMAAHHSRLTSYIWREYSARVKHVSVDLAQIVVQGDTGRPDEDVVLVEVPLYADPTQLSDSPTVLPLGTDGSFRLAMPRVDGGRDRLLSRWAVARKTEQGFELISPARYADNVETIQKMPMQKPRSKKGLGGFHAHEGITTDLDELGISAVTVNVWMNGIFRSDPGPGRTAFAFGGRTWYTVDEEVARYDKTLIETAKRGIVVSAIILFNQVQGSPDPAWARLLAHPDAHPSGLYVMPNMDSEEGILAYAAAMDYLAKRYSRPDNLYGRIHHWIMHNEVDAGWVWTNAGEKTSLLYMDLYHRSMRLAHLIARQYDANAKAFISLTHHWAHTPEPRFYPSKELLDLLIRFSAVEGDFDWALAHHPYPDSLLVPKAWEDGNVTFAMDTPKITFRNLEVLDNWARQRSTWFRGQQRRTVHCTEQGLNSPDYSEKSLTEQAAGMAYTWSKLKHLSAIDAFQYHAWIDNRGEFGLRIGLRRFPDDETDPLGKKPIWEVYRAMGTDREAEVFEPYKAIIGLKDWDEVRHKGKIK